MHYFRPMIAMLFITPTSGLAEIELSIYGGAQNSPHSIVTVTDDLVIPGDEFRMGWVGKSLSAPPYYGIRATFWKTATFGYGLDFSHNKIYPQKGDLPAGYEVLEFTDGLNILTINGYRRWENQNSKVTPYIGGGLGVSIPHVEVTYGSSETFGYQLTGPAVAWLAGGSFALNDRWSVFAEYKGTYSKNIADLETGGTLNNDVVTNAVNLGISVNF